MLEENIEPIVKFYNRQNDKFTTTKDEEAEIWQALADSKISMLLSAILKLVPLFIDKVGQIIAKNKTEEVAVNFTNPT